MLEVYLTGLSVSGGLILAIGAQNAFVLRQGLRGEHVALVCATCAASDALLILVGITSFRGIVVLAPWLRPAMLYAGAAFLIAYGARSLRSAFASAEALQPAPESAAGLGRTLATCLALTWLNPHVYLDTLLLIGSISTRFPGQEPAFAAGAMTASVAFFFALGYGAAILRPLFAKPAAWRVLEGMIALTMWVIAAELLLSGQ
ncbi:LysE/ArgO family amino acid transporter [Methylobacterium sp. J-048]|uniref:LysE/ArgO family amino acid transporter n=1 Tax=Methylobacterium sp. J-048 TaxID=2836635 RepID=UPI001FB8CA66|nr:LysE/ArgO family amino acid transporter [Methylobacterium sp. J-048]MCJ2060049.1 LysE/ArgO family amino acid transporter [Methylobacterium sp. J-048]